MRAGATFRHRAAIGDTSELSSNPGNTAEGTTATLRLRLAPSDARYGQGLVAGAKAMELFGDLETEIAIREGGDEGLCVGYESVEFLEPLFAGDFVEARATVRSQGRTSRRLELELFKVIAGSPDGSATVLDPPVIAARAKATIVVGTRDQVAASAAGEVGLDR
jgi:3-aminobutyryl-CoA ammonia-lyase